MTMFVGVAPTEPEHPRLRHLQQGGAVPSILIWMRVLQETPHMVMTSNSCTIFQSMLFKMVLLTPKAVQAPLLLNKARKTRKRMRKRKRWSWSVSGYLRQG